MYKDRHGKLIFETISETLDKMVTDQSFINLFYGIIFCVMLAIATYVFLKMSLTIKIIITSCIWIFFILYAIFSGVLKEE